MDNRRFFILLIFCLLFSHYLINLQFSYFPDSSGKALSIRIEMEGAGPEEIEKLLCNPIEQEILMMRGVSFFYSKSAWEETEITLFLDDRSDLNSSYLKLREIVDRKSLLFPGTAGKAVIRKSNSTNSPVFIVVPELLKENEYYENNRPWTEERIRTQLKGINGISQIHLSSSSAPNINIRFNEEKIASLKLNAVDLAGFIHQKNSIKSFCLDDSSQLIMDQRLKSVFDFENVTVGKLPLSEIAEISIVDSAVKSISRLNGRRQCIAWIYESGDANTINLCRKLRESSAGMPESLILFDKGKLIEEALKEMFLILGLSICSVMLITFVLLGKITSCLPVCLNIPFSIGGTLAVFNMFSWEINILVLSALALCSGMIIDNGIIVLEQGYKISRRAIWSSLGSTLIVLCPFLFASSELKTLCIPLIRALCLCLTLSLIFIVLTMNHCRGQSNNSIKFISLQNRDRICGWFVKYKKSAVIILVFFFLTSLYICKNIKYSQDFKLNNNSISFAVEYPAGRSKEWIENQLKELENFLVNIDSAEYSSSDYSDEKARFNLKLNDSSRIKELELSISEQMHNQGGFLYFEDKPKDSFYSVRILCHNRSDLYGESEKLAQYLHRILSDQNLILHYKKQLPILNIRTKNSLCFTTGISPLNIAGSLGLKLSPPVLGKWIPGNGYIIDIRIFSNKTLELTEINTLEIKGKGYYTLGELTDMSDMENYGPIEHYNTQRSLSFSFSTDGLGGHKINKIIEQGLKDYKIPEGISVIHGEQYSKRINSVRELIKLLSASILLLLILLIFIFESPFLPLSLITQILLCHVFTLSCLSLMHINLSVPVFFGLILNTGLSINNGLIVFSRFRKGTPSLEETVKAMMECRRTILAAALTTLTGFLPFLIATESSAQLLKALSVTVGSAVIFSIFLLLSSLFFFKPAWKK